MKNNIEKHNFPYPNKGKIPEIKIKNDNYFESNENITIKDYLNSIGTYVDNQFEICEKCGTRPNYYFCDDKECKQNICEYCYQSCHKKGHELIDLIKMKKEKMGECIEEINKIFSENYIFPKKEKEKEKIPRNYEIIDEARINFEIGENPMDYTSDITLIGYIKAKDYINYTHYKNIKECLNYLKKKYKLISMNYIIGKDDKEIKVFGEDFVKMYKDSCKIIYKEKKYNLTEYFELKNNENKLLEIKLFGILNITDLSGMFHGCSSLLSLNNIEFIDTTDTTSMKSMFKECSSLKELPDISKWNTKNVENFDDMFNDCQSLISLPSISNWNTENTTSMRYMFRECSSLKEFPDISKWKTKNVKNMNSMFKGCSSLISFPDISKWDTNKLVNAKNMFEGCSKIKKFPDISKWDTSSLQNWTNIFKGCLSTSIPDISKWEQNYA